MFCASCGNPLKDTDRFCSRCGTPVQSKASDASDHARDPLQEAALFDGERVTPNITYCSDGKYRWIYEMSLFRNPTIFLMVWKIFFFVILGVFAFMMLITVFQGDMNLDLFLSELRLMGYILLGMTALVGVSMLIYAAIMGGKYVAMFEMDNEGVNHKQIPTQAKKARKISEAAVIVGALAGSHSTVAAGISASRTEMYSGFSRTRKVRFVPRRNLIKVNGLLQHNQVYAAREDYDFVRNYILHRVPEKAKPKQDRR